MRRRVLAPALFLPLVWTSPGDAQAPPSPLVTDRPDFTESPLAVLPGQIQLEAGYTLTGDGRTDEHTLGEVLVRIGVADGLEARLGLESHVWIEGPAGDDAGFEDPSLGIKLALADGAVRPGLRPAVGLLIGTTVPGADDFGEGEWQPEATLALAWDLADGLSLGSNLGYAYASESGERFDQAFASLAFGFDLAPRVAGYLETFGFSDANPQGDDAAVVNGGATFLVHEDFQLDARAGAGLNGAAPDFFAGVGVAYRW
ncbi:MAG: transporter [Gemmatimonadetes bacterium]|nr:transporter [Gemmatimonadota bacterium]